MWILFIIAAILVAVGEILFLSKKTMASDSRKVVAFFSALLAGVVFTLFFITRCGWAFNAERFNLDKQIKEKLLNGEVIKSDTLHVLIRK